MSGIDRIIQNALGPVDGTFLVTGSLVLGTGVQQVSLPVVQTDTVYRLKFVNPNTGSINFAYMLVNNGSAAPSFTADAASTGGSLVLANSTEYVQLKSSKDLYVVAKAASTHWQITINILS